MTWSPRMPASALFSALPCEVFFGRISFVVTVPRGRGLCNKTLVNTEFTDTSTAPLAEVFSMDSRKSHLLLAVSDAISEQVPGVCTSFVQ